jgi:hypothetical protein
MEIDVRDRHLQQVVLAAKYFAGRSKGKANLPVGRTGILRLLHALRERDSLSDTGAQLVDSLLIVLVPGRGLSGQPSGCRLGIVACALNLIDE